MTTAGRKFPKREFICALLCILAGIVFFDRARKAEQSHTRVPGRFHNTLSPGEVYLAANAFVVAGVLWMGICVYTFRRGGASGREDI